MGNALRQREQCLEREQVIALGRLGWSLRRIEKTVHIRRETISGYLKAAGIPVRLPGAWGRRTPAKPANEVITDFGAESTGGNAVEAEPLPGRSPSASACEPWREVTDQEVRHRFRGRGLCDRTGGGRSRIPFCAPLPGTQSATAAEPAAGRSAHSATHAVSRPDREANRYGETNMNTIELQRSLRQLRLGGMADVLETRLRQAQVETMAPIDLISCLVTDELTRRGDRLLERRCK